MTLTVPGDALVGYLLATLRIAAWLVVVPPFMGRSIPATVKVVLSLGLAVTVVPSVASTGVPTDLLGLVTAAVTQVTIGAAMGTTTFLLFAALAAAGSLIDVFGGFALAQAYDPLGMNSNTVFGNFHQMLATMLLFASNAHLLVIGGLLSTFRYLPLGESPDIGTTTEVISKAFEVFFVTAVQIALPMIGVLFLADVGLALLTKVAPQLNAINVMYPAKIGLTLLLLGLSFPVLPLAMDNLVQLSQEAMAAIAGAG